jgi:hypothetical protein
LGPEPNPLQKGLLEVFEPKFSQNWDSCVQYHEKWCLPTSDRFQLTANSKVPGSKPNPRVQIFPLAFFGTYAL